MFSARDGIFFRGLASVWPWLCLGFIQPAAARLLLSPSFFPRLALAVTSHSFLLPRLLFESPNVFGCRLLFVSAGSLAAQPTSPNPSPAPAVQQGDEHVTSGHIELPCLQWGRKWNRGKETQPPQKNDKKRMRYDVSVSSYTAPLLTHHFNYSITDWTSVFFPRVFPSGSLDLIRLFFFFFFRFLGRGFLLQKSKFVKGRKKTDH